MTRNLELGSLKGDIDKKVEEENLLINKTRHAAKWPIDVTNGTERPSD